MAWDTAEKCEVVEPKEPSRRFKLVPFDQITLSSAPSYLVKGLIPRNGLVVIWGAPKCGKSFWAFDVAAHIALGWAYRGRKVRQGTVVYLVLEGEHGIGARVEAFRQRHLSENAEPIPLYLLPTRLNLIDEFQTLIDDITAQIKDNPPALIVVDTLNRSLNGSESRDEDMGAYIKAADAVREAFGAAVAVIHHSGIEASRPRGHTSLAGAADAQIAIKRDHADTICTTLEWLKDGPEGVEVYSRLESIEVGTDDDGNPISSCVVIEAEKPEKDTGHKLTKNQQSMLGFLDDFGPSGATVEDWNATARQEGLGVKRRADLSCRIVPVSIQPLQGATSCRHILVFANGAQAFTSGDALAYHVELFLLVLVQGHRCILRVAAYFASMFGVRDFAFSGHLRP